MIFLCICKRLLNHTSLIFCKMITKRLGFAILPSVTTILFVTGLVTDYEVLRRAAAYVTLLKPLMWVQQCHHHVRKKFKPVLLCLGESTTFKSMQRKVETAILIVVKLPTLALLSSLLSTFYWPTCFDPLGSSSGPS